MTKYQGIPEQNKDRQMSDWEPEYFKRHPSHVYRVWEDQNGDFVTVTDSAPGGRMLISEFCKSIGREFSFDDFRENYTTQRIMIRPDYMHCDEGDEIVCGKPGAVKAIVWEEK